MESIGRERGDRCETGDKGNFKLSPNPMLHSKHREEDEQILLV